MRLGPLTISRTPKAKSIDLITHIPSSRGGWWPVIRESFTGAWQRSIVSSVDDALVNPTFWSCVTLIAGDVAKMRVKLMQEDADGIGTEISSPAYSPVLTKPNHYQNRIQFYLYWILCKLTRGNTYALKERDNRNVVTGLYLLDPTRCQPVLGPTGDVYYALGQDVLSGIDEARVIVPAREIIHDRMYTVYHPLVGLSPVFACGHAALLGTQIVRNTTKLFQNGTRLGGVLTAPGHIPVEVVERIEKYWKDNYRGEENIGAIPVLGDGLGFSAPPMMNAVDAQLIDQLKWGDEKICSTFHVPPYMVGVGPMPSYNNIESLNQQYYAQCLQIIVESLELCLDEGLEFSNSSYGTEMDLDGLLRMDSATKMTTAKEGVQGGILAPNEARKRFNLLPVDGGNTPYLQQQQFSLAALDARDKAAPAPTSQSPTQTALPPVAQPTKAVEDPGLSEDEIQNQTGVLLKEWLAA